MRPKDDFFCFVLQSPHFHQYPFVLSQFHRNRYSGYDCSLTLCPVGDDPATYEDHVEVQLMQCLANKGNFTLSFRQAETDLLYPGITAVELKAALEKLHTIDHVNVYFKQDIMYVHDMFVILIRSVRCLLLVWFLQCLHHLSPNFHHLLFINNCSSSFIVNFYSSMLNP